MTVARFSHHASIATGANKVRIYSDNTRDPALLPKTLEVPDCDHSCEVVNVRDGVCHVFTRTDVYEVAWNHVIHICKRFE